MAPPLPPAPVGIKLNDAPAAGVVVELFHDVCCPYSRKMFDAVWRGVLPAMDAAGTAGRVAFLWQAVPQPWHHQSCCMHDAAMAAWLTDPAKAGAYIMAQFDHQTDYFDDACQDLTRPQMYDRLAALGTEAGIDAAAIRAKLSLDGVTGNQGLGDVTQSLKWAVKYHRTRGVHVTPTVFVNGTEAPDVSSGWSADEWMEKLGPMLG